MKLEILAPVFSVCQVRSLDPALLREPFCFIGKTDGELSVVCPAAAVPEDAAAREDGWRGFRFCGVLDFSLVGILAPVASLLAEAKIGIFAVSTYDTDYIFIKEENLARAADVLRGAGYEI